MEWEVHSRESRDVPPLEDFLHFISFRADVLSTTPSAPSEAKPRTSDVKPEHAPRRQHKATVNSTAHEVFNTMNVQRREDHIKNKNLCTNCLVWPQGIKVGNVEAGLGVGCVGVSTIP